MVKLLRLFLILLLSVLVFDNEVKTCASLTHSSSSSTSNAVHHHHLCIHHEKDALLNFKRLFVINPLPSDECSSNSSKTESWNGGDCCSWEGVECDTSTGHVIGLDLSCRYLYGTIPSNSTLFRLSHLRTLDLSDNDFNGSSISPAFGLNFPHLTHLQLIGSNLSGVIPSEISFLSTLIYLSIQPSFSETLRLEPHAFNMLIENLTRLETFFLNSVNISSSIPDHIGNLSSLVRVSLFGCEVYGDLPHRIFDLPNLQMLDLNSNDGMVGYLPKSNWSCSSPLNWLGLSGVRFSSELPDSSNCLSLRFLDLSGGEFFGSIPPWLGNLSLIGNLNLSENSFTGQVPFTLSNLKNIELLELDHNNLEGEIPNAFAHLTNLSILNLESNSFHGKLPNRWTNLTRLASLNLANNKLTSHIPSNISGLPKLNWLYLNNNSIGGTIPLSLFTLPLYGLDLSSNHLSGTIPSNLTGPKLWTIDLSNNNLSGTINPLSFVNLKELTYLHLSYNSLQGPLPLIPLSISYLSISNNKFQGDIPPSICDLSILEILDMSHNTMSGAIAKCISNFSSSLSVLNLGMNGLTGTIPMNFANGNLLRSINLNGNHLEGKVPRSMANCRHLEVLDLGRNNIKDIFPYWLESLPDLQVLVLRHNKFDGMVGFSGIEKVTSFPKLRIFDLSHNEFFGPLPRNYFLNLNTMRNVNSTQSTTLEYMGSGYYGDTVVINWKGVEFEVRCILNVLATIDFSGNRFEGEIPNDIGGLIGIQSLNLSSNVLTGEIPSSLEKLRLLESLDLSSNQLSGVIPQELTHITTLAVVNLSNNHLSGPIPQGLQFDTFQNDSYIGNLGLCGPPLSNKCSDNGSPHDRPSDNGGIFDGFGWKIVLLGYGCGTVFGLALGFAVFSTGKPKRLVTFVEEQLLKITERTHKQHAQGKRNAPRRG